MESCAQATSPSSSPVSPRAFWRPGSSAATIATVRSPAAALRARPGWAQKGTASPCARSQTGSVRAAARVTSSTTPCSLEKTPASNLAFFGGRGAIHRSASS